MINQIEINSQSAAPIEAGSNGVNAHNSLLNPAQIEFLRSVRVPVEVEIGQLTISAAELMDLFAGQVFEFAFESGRPVRLKIDGEEVATARFVMADNQLALEILDTNQSFCS